MAKETTTTDTYKTKLVSLIGAINFQSSTLGAKSIVIPFAKSVSTKPMTEVKIYEGDLRSEIGGEQGGENRLNVRTYSIVIAIRVYAIGREDEAQNHIAYLTEKIMGVLENNYNDVAWGDGNIDNNDLRFREVDLKDNYYTRVCILPIKKRVIVNI